MQSLKSTRLAEVDNFFKQSFEQKKNWFHGTLLLPFYENRFRLLRFVKNLNSTKRGAFFRHFCVSMGITTAHAHKSGVVFIFFLDHSNKRKKLRSKMTKIASRGSCLKFNLSSAMGAVRITSMNPKFNGSHFGLPPSSIHRMTGWVAFYRILWRMRTAPIEPSETANFVYNCV